MMNLLPTATAVIVLVISGVVHGLWSYRWAAGEDLALAAARLANLADDLGDWEAEELEKHDSSAHGLAGAVTRWYVHRITGTRIAVYLACGRGGPVSIHTPDVCYGARGYAVGPAARYTEPASASFPGADFLTANLRRPQDQSQQRVFWSWYGAGVWTVSDSPRRAFARQPLLYKLYLMRDLASGTDKLETDPCLDLARRLLPRLQADVFIPGLSEPGA
jgi:hypothetical protein